MTTIDVTPTLRRAPAAAALRDLIPAHRRADVGAGALIALQLVVYALVALPGSFYLDDLAATNRAAMSDLTWGYLRGPEGHHLSPGAMLWFWLQAHLMPFDHTGAVAVTLLLQGVVTLALWRLLRSLFGARPLALVPFAVYVLSPLSVPTFAWWIQSVCLLPVHLSIIGATHQHVAYLRTRRLRHALAAGTCVLLGLLFWEKAALAVVLPFLVTLVAFTSGSPRRRAAYLLRQWPGWLALALPPLAFAAVYSQQDRQPARAVPAGRVAHLLWDSTTHTVVPALLGGPWRWSTGNYYGIAEPTPTQVAVSGGLVLLLLAVTVRRRRAALGGWLLLALYVPASLAPVAAGRLALYGLDVGRDSRYLTDISVAAAVALALVLMPVRDRGPAAAPAPVRRRTWLAVTAVGLAFATSAAVSDLHFAQRWHENPTGAYLATLQSDLAASKGSVALYDAQLPVDVLSPFYRPYNVLSALLAQLPGEARFNDGQSPLSVVTTAGSVVAARLVPATRGVPGPDGPCGYGVRADRPSVTVPLGKPVFDFVGRTLRVELLLSGPTSVRVDVNGRRVDDGRPLPAGPAAVVAPLQGGEVQAVVISGLAPGAAACVLAVTVGTPTPLRSAAR